MEARAVAIKIRFFMMIPHSGQRYFHHEFRSHLSSRSATQYVNVSLAKPILLARYCGGPMEAPPQVRGRTEVLNLGRGLSVIIFILAGWCALFGK